MYQHAKIYKITSDSTDKIYIGSTCNPLSKRIGQHRTDYKRFIEGKNSRRSSCEIIKLGDAIITLIEDYSCESKEELLSRERYYIDLHKDICVNKNLPTRTIKEWMIDNKELIKQYQIDNKDKLALTNKQYHIDNKEAIAQRKKEYNHAHQEATAKRRTQKIDCICGCVITRGSKPKHERSIKHIAYIQSQS